MSTLFCMFSKFIMLCGTSLCLDRITSCVGAETVGYMPPTCISEQSIDPAWISFQQDGHRTQNSAKPDQGIKREPSQKSSSSQFCCLAYKCVEERDSRLVGIWENGKPPEAGANNLYDESKSS